MKQETAVEHLRAYMFALQKYRSSTTLEIPDLTEEMKAESWPWVFGEKCPLPALAKILADVDKGNDLDPIAYYNMMYILYQFTPEILAAIAFTGTFMPEEQPSPMIVVQGWD